MAVETSRLAVSWRSWSLRNGNRVTGRNRPPVTRRRNSWDVLRAAAILLVVVQHATWGGPLLVPELGARPFEMSVQVGASALMVISAYFICQTLRSSGPWLLLRNRLGRMLPPLPRSSPMSSRAGSVRMRCSVTARI
ncbi:acyltransferase [Lentzea atacamensis]|uniref:acyltransferase n=1 Tax=Lentzea atacamensis TaxID=531938 RepID=UPI0011B4B1E7|nr:acyltransferase [Lentzea atacamensis]